MHALIIEDEFLAAALLQDMLAEMGFDSFDADLRERRDALVVAKPVHRSDLKRAVRQAMGQSG